MLTMKADVMHAPPRGLGQFDIIVSNPPYVTEDEMQMLDRSVADFEPHEALYGGEDGLDFYHAICDSWGELLVPNGRLLFECGWHQPTTWQASCSGTATRMSLSPRITAACRVSCMVQITVRMWI